MCVRNRTLQIMPINMTVIWVRCLTGEELSSFFTRFWKAVQDKALVSAGLGQELVLHHLHFQLLIQHT